MLWHGILQVARDGTSGRRTLLRTAHAFLVCRAAERSRFWRLGPSSSRRHPHDVGPHNCGVPYLSRALHIVCA